MRYTVTVRSGSAILHTARRSTYASARALASSFIHYPATIRPEFTEREAMLCCVLVCALITFAFARALGA